MSRDHVLFSQLQEVAEVVLRMGLPGLDDFETTEEREELG
jgi:hypothetical protein